MHSRCHPLVDGVSSFFGRCLNRGALKRAKKKARHRKAPKRPRLARRRPTRRRFRPPAATPPDTAALDGPLALQRSTVARILMALGNKLPYLVHVIMTFVAPFASPEFLGSPPASLDFGADHTPSPWNWSLYSEWKSHSGSTSHSPKSFRRTRF